MDLSVFPQVASITVICFVIGQAVKTLDFLNTKYIPVIVLMLGLVMGIAGHFIGIPGLIEANLFDAAAIGAVSGLASSGVYSAYQNLVGKYDNC